MRNNWGIILILLTFICSCSDKAESSDSYAGITILNSGPRGGGYTDSTGRKFEFRIFRIPVFNDTVVSAELTIHFFSDSFALLPESANYLRVFLFPDTMTPDTMQEVYNFGVTGIESFLDKDLNKPTILKTTIQPEEEHILYIGVLFNNVGLGGHTRARLFINGQNINDSFFPDSAIKTSTKSRNELDLIFGIGVDQPHHYSLIPCGQIIYKE